MNTVPPPRLRQIVAVTQALSGRWSGHVQVPGHMHGEKENSDGKSLKSSALQAVLVKSEAPEA